MLPDGSFVMITHACIEINNPVSACMRVWGHREGYVWYDVITELCEGECMIWCYSGIMWGNMYDMML